MLAFWKILIIVRDVLTGGHHQPASLLNCRRALGRFHVFTPDSRNSLRVASPIHDEPLGEEKNSSGGC